MAGSSKYDFSYPMDDFVTVFDDSDEAKGKELVQKQNGKNDELLRLIDHKNQSKFSNVSLPQSVLLASLVEHLCNLYESDSNRAKKLFQVICIKLQKLSLIAPVAYLDEYSSIRMQYKTSLYDLLQSSLNIHSDSAIEGNNASSLIMANFSPDPKRQLSFLLDSNLFLKLPIISTEDVFDIDMSRYNTEFTELEVLGKGAYGKVYKAQHKIDHQIYAVKRVLIDDLQDQNLISIKEYSQRLLREVNALSSLNHTNIVRYFNSWLEHQTLRKGSKKGNIKITQLSSPKNNKSYNSLLTSNALDSDISSSSCQEETNLSASSLEDSVTQGKFWNDRSRLYTSSMSGDKSWNSLDFESGQLSASKVVLDSGDFGSEVKFDSYRTSTDPISIEFEANSKIKSKQNAIMPRNSIKLTQSAITPPRKSLVLYIQMQICDLSLRQWLDNRNALISETSISSVKKTVNLVQSTSIFQQILCGLQYIHNAKLIHRDIKPSNIFLLNTNSSVPLVQIGDFGLSRHVTSPVDPVTPLSRLDPFADGDPSTIDEKHTAGVGTTVYAAPEQLQSKDYCNKVDIYSTGIVLFELLWPIPTQHERADAMKMLRKGKVPDDFMQCWPAFGALLKSLMNDLPEKRLSAECILKSNLFTQNKESSSIRNTSHLLQIVELLVKNRELEVQVFKYRQKLLSLGIDPDH